MTTDQQGLIVLSLVQGKMVNNIPSNLTSLQISRELKDFLNLCFVFEDKNKGANELLDHDFITAAVTYSAEDDTAAAGDTQTLKSNSTITYENHSLPSQSRVSRDFEQLEMLGKGAFGNVQKVLFCAKLINLMFYLMFRFVTVLMVIFML